MADDDDISPAAENRLAHFEDCRSAIDQLFFEALTTKGPGAFGEFLDFAVKFSKLSVYNAMLVRVQRPGAGAVATRSKWASMGRRIKPDAVPIVILQPFGPVLFIFEQGDTEGGPLPGEKDNPLFATGKLSQKVYDQSVKAAGRFGITVEVTAQYGALRAGTAAGFLIRPAVDGCRFRIRLNARHDLPTRFATLAHELGHVYCGHVGADIKGRWPERRLLTEVQLELEAEAVAWLVCRRNGVEARSREYLSRLMKDADLSGVSMYAIFEAANRVESRTPPAK
jgi:hypothetical protein